MTAALSTSSGSIGGGQDACALIAPDSFKGSFSSAAVAEAIAAGYAETGQSASVCPVADGGEGTLDALSAAFELELRVRTVADPLGRDVHAQFGVGRGGVAVVETAAASGLGLVGADERDAVAASTRGTGQLVAAAVAAGASSIYVAVGGSATTDGGKGAINAIREAGGLRGAQLTVLCDVQVPFEQAAIMFSPQKGAGDADVRRLTARLARQAGSFARDPTGIAMTGAAGGLAGGLWAEFGAELTPGAAFVLDALNFDSKLRTATCVVTGEGRLDSQTLTGKVVAEIAARAKQVGVPCHAVVGTTQLSEPQAHAAGLATVIQASTRAELCTAGARLARDAPNSSTTGRIGVRSNHQRNERET